MSDNDDDDFDWDTEHEKYKESLRKEEWIWTVLKLLAIVLILKLLFW